MSGINWKTGYNWIYYYLRASYSKYYIVYVYSLT